MKIKMLDKQQTYSSVLQPNLRKKRMLQNTFEYLQKTKNIFYYINLAYYGGLEPNLIHSYTDEKIDVDLKCATLWFRPMKQPEYEKYQIISPLLEKTLKIYLHKNQISDASLQYVNSAIGKDCFWVDCRKIYQEFCKQLQVQNLQQDLQTLLQLKHLPIVDGPFLNAFGIISQQFGIGEKEDRTSKVKILSQILQKIQKNESSIQNAEDLCAIMLDAVQAKNITDLKAKYDTNAAGGRNAAFLSPFKQGYNFSSEGLDHFIESLKKKIKEKNQPVVWQHMPTIKIFIENKTGIPFKQGPWSEALNNSLADIHPKNVRNYNFAFEQLEKKIIIDANQDAKEAATILNQYFTSPFFNAENHFIIKAEHFGGRQIKDFYHLLESSTTEQAVDEYYDDLQSSLNKCPIKSLLHYIASTNLTPETLQKAANYNFIYEKYTQQKAHPTTIGNLAFTWSKNSAILGCVIPPQKAKNPHDTRIWCEIDLLNGSQWESHHIPFCNARFYEEIYALSKNESQTLFRNQRFGAPISKQLTDIQVEILQNTEPKFRKATKRLLRTQNAIAQRQASAVQWPNCSLGIKCVDDQFLVAVNAKFKIPAPPKCNFTKGTTIVSWDSNQTTSNTYAVLQITNDPKDIRFHNHYMKIIETGTISSEINVNERVIDVLSYQGIANAEFKDWRLNCKSFVKQLSGEWTKEFDKIANKQFNLYFFNFKYAKLLTRILRTTKQPQMLKDEIIRFITGPKSILKLGSLHHSCFDCLRACKSLINAYFAYSLNKQDATDQDKQDYDPTMFELRLQLEKKRQNKGKEKVNRIANALITIALQNQATVLVGEGNLSTATKKNNKNQNNRNLDWLARAVFHKVQQLSEMHNIALYPIPPHFTSHQDPFVHRNPHETMRARFCYVPKNEIGDSHMKTLAKKNTIGQTATYYQQAFQNFIEHYQLHQYEPLIKQGKLECYQLTKLLKDDNILIPRRGARFYLATHPVTSDCKQIIFNKTKFWLCDADQVAAVNIALSFIMSCDKPKKK